MFNISHLRSVSTVIFVLIVVGIGYAGWKTLRSSQGLRNPDNTLTKPVTTNDSKISGIDASDWKIYRNHQYGIEVKYPPYYYAVPETEENLLPSWGWKTPVFFLHLSEVPPGIGVKDTIYPDIYISPPYTFFLLNSDMELNRNR